MVVEDRIPPAAASNLPHKLLQVNLLSQDRQQDAWALAALCATTAVDHLSRKEGGKGETRLLGSHMFQQQCKRETGNGKRQMDQVTTLKAKSKTCMSRSQPWFTRY